MYTSHGLYTAADMADHRELYDYPTLADLADGADTPGGFSPEDVEDDDLDDFSAPYGYDENDVNEDY